MGKILVFRTKAEREQEQIDLDRLQAEESYYTGLSDMFSPEEIDAIRKDLESEDNDS